MKNISLYIFFALSASLLASCKKGGAIPTLPLASLNVTNVVIGGNTLILNTSALSVADDGYYQFAVNAGNSQINLADTTTTPATVYYSQTMQTVNGSYYSLFLTGTSPAAVDNVLIKESYKNYTDSMCAVRFINLSPGSNPVSVNIQGQPNGSTAASLAYKAYSNFIQLPATLETPNYAFEIRDAESGNLIASYSLQTPYFHNVTLALYGMPGSQNVLLVNDY